MSGGSVVVMHGLRVEIAIVRGLDPRCIRIIKLITISSPEAMRLLLPFIVLPLATLAVPPPQDVPAVDSVAARILAEPYKPKGDFIRSCKDVKLDGKKDDMHELIATCAAGDGTEVTSKLDLSYCYSVLSDGGNNVNPKKPDDPTCSKYQELWNDHGYLRCKEGKGQHI
ncbi:hypothetical protein BDV41DRAFT_568758 [Aspergillus transmontanensis]|uniref:Cyanovirin-N domain-containing protein n=1 Tax=Aspergillus transmontanensis TaxID=1034304 RepID=A0A5N6VHY7_9EURO|nr:hypothetical protein BDV41DRAFT_568758 [Aspergillus transmontanensis]